MPLATTESGIARGAYLLTQGNGYQRIAETLNAEAFTTSRASR